MEENEDSGVIADQPITATKRGRKLKEKVENIANKDVAGSLPPPPRPWITTSYANTMVPSCIITVMTYNILSSSYANPKTYEYCPPEYLDWQIRGPEIMAEIRYHNSDIICLQEVEMEQYHYYFLPSLQSAEYTGIFAPKMRAHTMSEPKKRLVDGCAIFWKAHKFTYVSSKLVDYQSIAMQNSAGSKDILDRVWSRDNIALLALLKTTTAAWTYGMPYYQSQVEQFVLVGNTHLHWDPEFPDVKIMQTLMMTKEVIAMIDDARCTFSLPGMNLKFSDVKLLLCGDFNSLMDSSVFEFLSTGKLSLGHPDFQDFDYYNAILSIMGSEFDGMTMHPLKLASACGKDIMPYTNYAYNFKEMIDYIFYSSSNMAVLGALGPISSEWLNANSVVGYPHRYVPSDHFPVVAMFQFFY